MSGKKMKLLPEELVTLKAIWKKALERPEGLTITDRPASECHRLKIMLYAVRYDFQFSDPQLFSDSARYTVRMLKTDGKVHGLSLQSKALDLKALTDLLDLDFPAPKVVDPQVNNNTQPSTTLLDNLESQLAETLKLKGGMREIKLDKGNGMFNDCLRGADDET